VIALAFAALSDPTRREIVQQLAKGAARVTDLAQPSTCRSTPSRSTWRSSSAPGAIG